MVAPAEEEPFSEPPKERWHLLLKSSQIRLIDTDLLTVCFVNGPPKVGDGNGRKWIDSHSPSSTQLLFNLFASREKAKSAQIPTSYKYVWVFLCSSLFLLCNTVTHIKSYSLSFCFPISASDCSCWRNNQNLWWNGICESSLITLSQFAEAQIDNHQSLLCMNGHFFYRGWCFRHLPKARCEVSRPGRHNEPRLPNIWMPRRKGTTAPNRTRKSKEDNFPLQWRIRRNWKGSWDRQRIMKQFVIIYPGSTLFAQFGGKIFKLIFARELLRVPRRVRGLKDDRGEDSKPSTE